MSPGRRHETRDPARPDALKCQFHGVADPEALGSAGPEGYGRQRRRARRAVRPRAGRSTAGGRAAPEAGPRLTPRPVRNGRESTRRRWCVASAVAAAYDTVAVADGCLARLDHGYRVAHGPHPLT